MLKYFPNKTEKQLKNMIDKYNHKMETYLETYDKYCVWYSLVGKTPPTVKFSKNEKIIEQLKHQYYSDKIAN